jgi:hypothetical protein
MLLQPILYYGIEEVHNISNRQLTPTQDADKQEIFYFGANFLQKKRPELYSLPP